MPAMETIRSGIKVNESIPSNEKESILPKLNLVVPSSLGLTFIEDSRIMIIQRQDHGADKTVAFCHGIEFIDQRPGHQSKIPMIMDNLNTYRS